MLSQRVPPPLPRIIVPLPLFKKWPPLLRSKVKVSVHCWRHTVAVPLSAGVYTARQAELTMDCTPLLPPAPSSHTCPS